MNDKRLVELVVLPATLSALVRSLNESIRETGANLDHIISLLEQACREPLDGLDARRTAKVARRAMRCTTAAMQVITAPPAPTYAVQWLAVARLIVMLTEEEVLIVGGGSAFAQSWDAMLALGLGTVSPAGEAQAEGLAACIRQVLTRNGLF